MATGFPRVPSVEKVITKHDAVTTIFDGRNGVTWEMGCVWILPNTAFCFQV
uniref:Uncharacterized protein n=1 Tax=Anguilla anguilla TaxID=7936 RepID=A0A0E9PU70_ANGAN